MAWQSYILSDPKVCDGQPYLKDSTGNEVIVSKVIGAYVENNYETKSSLNTLAKDGIHLDATHIQACIDYICYMRVTGKIKEEDYTVNMWCDPEYEKVRTNYGKHRETLREIAKRKTIPGYEPQADVPPHIRNWFENPIYQLLIRPSKDRIQKSFDESRYLTWTTFVIGVLLLAIGVYLALQSRSENNIAAGSLVLSGTATIVASLFRAIAILKEIAVQHAKLQIAISAGMVSIDTLQRIVGHQENLKEAELNTTQEITKAFASLISAFEKPSKQD